MKKIFGFMLLSVLMLSSVAFASTITNVEKVGLAKKDPTTWETISVKGSLYMYQTMASGCGVYKTFYGYTYCAKKEYYKKDMVRLKASGLESNTMYSLIYYGDETHNDVWPYATCIGETKSTSWGSISKTFEGSLNNPLYSQYLDNGKDEKLWLVPSSDVDCNAGQMTAWNPEDILFETRTI